jgi:apolipoprotein N-acyltransferase
MKNVSINKKTLVLTILSGIFLFLSFPKYGVGFLAWIALVPLLLALKNKSILQSLIIGFITGLTYYIGIIYWIAHVIVNYGYLPYWSALLIMLLLAAYLSVYVAIFSAGVSYFRKKNITDLISAPCLWVILEYIKSHLLTGFPWENLAYSQYLYRVVIQIVDVTGIYGLAFIIVLINVILNDFLSEEQTQRSVIKEFVLGCLIFVIVYGYGVFRIEDVETRDILSDNQEILLVQGSIDQNLKWFPKYQEETINIYKNLTGKENIKPGGLVVWPETATPFFFQDIDEKHLRVASVAKNSEGWLLFGSPSYKQDADKKLNFYNSAFLLSPDGKVRGQYNKVHLVPYGEYVPLRKIFPFINKLTVGIGDFKNGKGFYPLNMGLHPLGVLICYEGILPEASRMYKKNGAELLVNITNDAWFGETSAPYQHLSMTVFRAVENRLYLVRAANTGISAIINPTGLVVGQTGLFEKETLKGTVKFSKIPTCYEKYGDIFIYFVIILTMLLFVYSRKKRERRNKDVE